MITSTANSKVKRLAALIQKSKARRNEGVFIAEGLHMFREAPPEWIREIYVSESFLDKNKGVLAGQRYEALSDEVFRKVSDTQAPQGVLCVLSMPSYALERCMDGWPEAPLLLLLEDLQDPGNLGTILRSGEGAGADGVIMTRQTADIFNPKVIRSTMGSIYRMPFFVVDGLADTIHMLRNRGICVCAAHPDGGMDYDRLDYTQPAAFVIGNEGSGLRPGTAEAASLHIRIPMAGQAESLNAATAATILMYEAMRQRRRDKELPRNNFSDPAP